MKISFFSFIMVLFSFLTIDSYAQTSSGTLSGDQNPYSNPVILAHYDSLMLQQLETADPSKFNTIVYYYTRSFLIERIQCTECVPADIATFDVSDYEQFRKPHERYVREWHKQGFKLTLLSMDELQHKFPIHLVKLQQ